MNGIPERDASSKADRALKLRQALTRAQIAERLRVKPDSVKRMVERAKQRRAKMALTSTARCRPEPAALQDGLAAAIASS